MAKIEKVQLRVTLRTRERFYRLGETVMAPLPEDIMDELAAKTDTLDIIEAPKPKPKPKVKPKPKAEPEVNDG
jgi:hypothetical protein